jgi:hypothetical protein
MLSVCGEASAGAGIVSTGVTSRLTQSGLLVAFLCREQANEGDSVERRDFTDDPRKAMLKAIIKGHDKGWGTS